MGAQPESQQVLAGLVECQRTGFELM